MLNDLNNRIRVNLYRIRDDRGANKRVFVAEHGLNAAEVAELMTEARKLSGEPSQLSRFQFVVAVFATEVAWKFEGDQYWQTFADEFGDSDSKVRDLVRDAFKGVRVLIPELVAPEGPWAEHFSIIAPPIFHAVLPRDLHPLFFRALDEAVGVVELASRADVKSLDELLSAWVERTYSGASGARPKRFLVLAGQPGLLGSLALAVLSGDAKSGSSAGGAFSREVVERITQSLLADQRRSRRLRELRKIVETARSIPLAPNANPVLGTAPTQKSVTRWLPAIFLHKYAAAGQDLFAPYLRLPRIEEPGARNRIAEGQTYSIAGQAAKGEQPEVHSLRGLLNGPEQKRLSAWPPPCAEIFVPPVPGLSWFLTEQTRWWFCVDTGASVGRVRQGRSYVVTMRTEIVPPDELAPQRVDLRCRGVFAYRVCIPNSLTPEAMAALKAVGQEFQKSITLEPVGSAGVGHEDAPAVWLSGERPTYVVYHNLSKPSLHVEISERSVETSGRSPRGVDTSRGPDFDLVGDGSFLVLPQSGHPGLYSVRVDAAGLGDDEVTTFETEFMVQSTANIDDLPELIDVLAVGFDTSADFPGDFTLRSLLRGDGFIHMEGPEAQPVLARLRLNRRTTSTQDQPASTGPLVIEQELSVTNNRSDSQARWRDRFGGDALRRLMERKQVAEADIDGSTIELSLQGIVIWRENFVRDRELRWGWPVRRSEAKLPDLTGILDGENYGTDYLVRISEVSKPNLSRPFDLLTDKVERPSLLVAARGKERACVLVGPGTTPGGTVVLHGFAALGREFAPAMLNPWKEFAGDAIAHLSEVRERAREWATCAWSANLNGRFHDLGFRLTQSAIWPFLNAEWLRIEDIVSTGEGAARPGPLSQRDIPSIIRRLAEGPVKNRTFRSDLSRWTNGATLGIGHAQPSSAEDWVTALHNRFVSPPAEERALWSIALRAATCPGSLPADAELRHALNRVTEERRSRAFSLARACALTVSQGVNQSGPPISLAGWKWSAQ
jgi:hypothetical protein